ncbi:MAG TPA: molybdopterin-dependent oxidoreductase, partial [Methyloradius sp.]
YQLFGREFGTNNFPDCSNMCHESTSAGLPEMVGIGKGSVTLEDFEHTDTLLLFGHNPATNHPRMLGELRECAKRGVKIVSINPLRERGLEKFADPQSMVEMSTFGSTKISGTFIQPKLGGDLAFVKGMMKLLVEWDDAAIRDGKKRVVDIDFLEKHTVGYEALAADIRNEDWTVILEESGVSFEHIEAVARIYAQGERVISTWGMGITQHKHSVATIQMIPTSCFCAATLVKRVRDYARCAGIVMCRAIALLASMRNLRRNFLIAWEKSINSNLLVKMAMTLWPQSEPCWMVMSKCLSALAAISRLQPLILTRPGKGYVIAT